jgi:transcriptional regulator with XRE-family HTH domain
MKSRTRNVELKKGELMTAGEKLKELRGNRSQAEVAKAVMVSDSAISSYENDERVPRDDVKKRLAKYYESTVQDIFYAE